MKRFVVLVMIVFAVSRVSYSQNIYDIFAEASKMQHVEHVKVGGFLMWLSNKCSNNAINGLKSVEVFDLSACGKDSLVNLKKKLDNIKDEAEYQTLLQVKDKKESVRIMVKQDDKYIKELYIICMDGEEPALISIKGKIKKDNLGQLISEYQK